MGFKQIASFDNFMLANMTLGLLEENYINCHLVNEYSVTIDPILSNSAGGIRLEVEESQVERAMDLIKDAEATYLNDIVCPYCHQPGLYAEEKINKPESFWGKLKNQIAYGQTETYSKKYRCQHCKSIMDELPLSF